jgi:hypothetical protein
MGLVVMVLLLAQLLGGMGLVFHMLWIVAAVVFVAWLAGFGPGTGERVGVEVSVAPLVTRLDRSNPVGWVGLDSGGVSESEVLADRQGHGGREPKRTGAVHIAVADMAGGIA